MFKTLKIDEVSLLFGGNTVDVWGNNLEFIIPPIHFDYSPHSAIFFYPHRSTVEKATLCENVHQMW